MIRAILIATSLFACTCLSAQIQLTEAYFPAAGDTLLINNADSAWAASLDLITEGGDDVVWDFSDPVASFEERQSVSVADNPNFPNAELEVFVNIFSRSYFRVENGSFLLVGASTNPAIFPDFQVDLPFSEPRPERRTEIQPGDSFSSEIFSSLTISPDSLPVEVVAQIPLNVAFIDSFRITSTSVRTDTVDGWGTVKLGDNFYPVLREKRTDRVNIKIEAKAIFGGFLDITQEIINQAPEVAAAVGDQPPVTTLLWWNNDSKEPIAEIQLDSSETVTSMNYKRALEATSTRGPSSNQAQVKVYPNPTTDFTTIEVAGLPPGSYVLSVSSMLGKEIFRQQIIPTGDPARLPLQFGNNPAGLYIASLRNARGRIIASRRIVLR